MTNAEIDLLSEGHQLDVLVANACGFGELFVVDYFWWPSNDWAIAMEAAQKFGLFHYLECKISQMGDNWIVLMFDPHRRHDVILAKNILGPVAICHAILKANQIKSNPTNDPFAGS